MAAKRAAAPIDRIAGTLGRGADALAPIKPIANGIADEIYKAGAQTPQDFVSNVAVPGIVGGVKAVGEGLRAGIETASGFDATAISEGVTIFVPNRGSLRSVRKLVREQGEVRLLAARQFGARSGVLARTHVKLDHLRQLLQLTDDISDRQFEALQTAVKSGYYDSPRKVGVADLAKAMGVDEATYSEHLRKAENKILPAFTGMGLALRQATAQSP